jgi:3-oxoacyl-[acyl-carrier protein] reductase
MHRFDHKHVVITGAARGIGFEIALQFAKEGAVLSIIDNHQDNLMQAAETLRSMGAITFTYGIDVSVHGDVYDVIDRAEACQPIDILINNAGIAQETPFLQIEAAEWKQMLDVNLSGMFFVSQAVCRHMIQRQKGVVINMGSKNGLDGEAGYAHYNASKGGIVMLTKTMALEFAHVGIRVNCVCPGYIQTPMSLEIDSKEITDQFVDRYVPLNRPGKVTDVAPLFLFLASDDSQFITGQTFIVDGGQLAGQKPGPQLLKKLKSDGN